MSKPSRAENTRDKAFRQDWNMLSDQQRIIMGMVSCGMDQPEIAHRIGVSVRTVAYRMSDAYKQLGVAHEPEVRIGRTLYLLGRMHGREAGPAE